MGNNLVLLGGISILDLCLLLACLLAIAFGGKNPCFELKHTKTQTIALQCLLKLFLQTT
jgi:hypothetical protein